MIPNRKYTREEVRSDEEFYFHFYLDELLEHGFVSSWEYEPKTFQVLEKKSFTWTKQLKTKQKSMEHILVHPMTYTPDYRIVFTEKAKGHLIAGDFDNPIKFPFVDIDRDGVVWIDVKGTFRQWDVDRRFAVQQKLMIEKHNIYVQKMLVPKIFLTTFAPIRYKFSVKTMVPSKQYTKHSYLTSEQYNEHYKRKLSPKSVRPVRQADY